ncbi:MAG: hypothetical protein IT323_11855, partial [Anaerolineae bacterium]|nr:hypothetical protein [Anaerolineae bacterium]
VARAFGREPRQAVPEDLQRLKQIMEQTPISQLPLQQGNAAASDDGVRPAEESSTPSNRLSE